MFYLGGIDATGAGAARPRGAHPHGCWASADRGVGHGHHQCSTDLEENEESVAGFGDVYDRMVLGRFLRADCTARKQR